MSKLRFDGRVAIVTGAGGQHPSPGRPHTTLLPERGATVVAATMIPDPGEVPAKPTGAAVIDAVFKPYQPI